MLKRSSSFIVLLSLSTLFTQISFGACHVGQLTDLRSPLTVISLNEKGVREESLVPPGHQAHITNIEGHLAEVYVQDLPGSKVRSAFGIVDLKKPRMLVCQDY